MSDRNLKIPRANTTEEMVVEVTKQVAEQTNEPIEEAPKKAITQEESDTREKVFFEEDEKVRLRDGKTYYIPPLGLRDARKLMKKLNTIDSGVIIANLIPDSDDEDDRYDELLDVLLMAFKPYYSHMTIEHLEEYVDLETAKKIIDCMIGLNGLKKSM
ncbi:putative DNA polymerase III subunit gamma/tau [Brevibacillus phage SecTim467]|uniref:Putative DNA polymerase III subunit gamma/tau n=2 Tax=Jenstvirus jenst TaxID=1982225 RepID=A0A0K2CPC8_9CAUD|nr:putative DNA polymerase III subunit gamma/tau [Brevibacillus phage Jenst]ALA07163.1 putative DNA polymerase III subunit gamma/tau [Brevibacillus phage Jenst]ALA07588.1 putative DNA polymerase III subunit gamma/tau [Brevibacillus phage SecTim467]